MSYLLPLLVAASLLPVHPDLSNHWRWASASIAVESNDPLTPIPSPTPQPTPPTPNPTPVPSPTPTPYKVGDKCPNCDKGWLTTDSVVKERCWKCKGDGIINDGDPILTGESSVDESDNPEQGEKETEETTLADNDSSGESQGSETSSPTTETREESPQTTPTKSDLPPTQSRPSTLPDAQPDRIASNPSISSRKTSSPDQTDNPITPTPDDSDQKAICYKPIYSKDGYWIWDLEGKKWVRSAKQPGTYVTVPSKTGHWETKAYQYKSCNGRNCVWKTGYKKVWVADAPTKVLQPAPPQTSHYPIRGSWWTGCRNWTHLTKGVHAGKFNPAYLQSLSWEEPQSLHSDNHEGCTKWQYVNN